MNDQSILALFHARDERALRESADKYGRYCAAVALNILSDARDAEECVNDTWLRAWQSIPPAAPDDLGAYLAKITRRLSLDRLAQNTADKRGGHDSPTALDELADILPDPETTDDALDAAALSADIDRFLRAQSTRVSDIFVLRYFHGESVSAIASRYRLSANATSALLSRVRKKLKKYLIGKGYSL